MANGHGVSHTAQGIAIIWQIEMMIWELQQPPGGGRGGGREGLKFLSAMKRFSSTCNWETSPVGIFAPAVGMGNPDSWCRFFLINYSRN